MNKSNETKISKAQGKVNLPFPLKSLEQHGE